MGSGDKGGVVENPAGQGKHERGRIDSVLVDCPFVPGLVDSTGVQLAEVSAETIEFRTVNSSGRKMMTTMRPSPVCLSVVFLKVFLCNNKIQAR